MKTFALFVLLLIFTPFSRAEEVAVFACDTKSHDIEWDESGVEKATTFLTFHRVGKLLSKLDTGEVSLSQIAADAAAYDSSNDPFFGPGVNYIMKDSDGQHFIIFFEYQEGHKTFNGFRMAINKISLIDSKLGVYQGSSYAGTSFDKNLMAQLKTLTQRNKAEQGGVPNP